MQFKLFVREIKMRTVLSLLVKFASTFAAAWIAFGIVDINNIYWIIFVAATATVLNYLIGDLIVLPSMGSAVSSLGDGIVAAIAAYVIDFFTYNFLATVNGLIIFAMIVIFTEYFFHLYLFNDEKAATDDFHRDMDIK
jgi:hypothetical protein